MATPRQKLKVGIFLLVSFIGIAAGVAVISGLYETEGRHYWIEFEESILGLYEGGMVEYMGVPVGRVTGIRVTAEKKPLVDIVIDPTKVELQKGVQAEVVIYSLAAGTMAISLSGGDPSNPVLPQGSQIPANPSMITAVSTQAQELMENINSITQVINDGLKGMEEGDLAAIVDQAKDLLDSTEVILDDGREMLGQATGAIEDIRGRAQPALDDAQLLMSDLRATLADARELIQNANSKISEFDVGSAQAELQKVLSNMADLSVQINKTMSEFDNLTANVLHEADNVEFTLRRSLQELSDSLETMRVFVEDLQRNPASLVRGRKGPEEER